MTIDLATALSAEIGDLATNLQRLRSLVANGTAYDAAQLLLALQRINAELGDTADRLEGPAKAPGVPHRPPIEYRATNGPVRGKRQF
jgi:hypothetical protein